MKLGEDNKRLMLIDGELTAGDSGEWLPSVNPATEEIIGYTPAGDAADVDAAASSASRAWPAWSALGVEGRAEALREVARQAQGSFGGDSCGGSGRYRQHRQRAEG